MNPQQLAGIGLIAVPVLLSLTLHEYGHARVAMAFGDHTARLKGRVTLNPLAHLSLLGTLCFLFGPFGWAKPVPVDWSRLRPYRIGDICVSLAGVGMNFLLLISAAVAMNIMAAAGVSVDLEAPPTPIGVAAFMLSFLMIINLALIAFNLIPLYPLDGHHVVRELLPHNKQHQFMEFQVRSGRFLLLGLLVLPWLIEKVTGRVADIDPIGIFLGHVIWPTIFFLLGSRAEELFASAYLRYIDYLPW
ncbi:MAG: site-2 protease family protein [Planctomycetota bacterium]|nr:site-2 protease family protein [Planctomycetota bacterium]